MKVLVTGAGGFIGSHLVESLVERGHDVRAFVRYSSVNSWGWLESSCCKDDIEIITGDVRDYDIVKTAVAGCDVVFHLAALIGIPYSYVSPLAYVRTNIEGTYNILQASLGCQVARVIHTSTSEVYGTANYVPIDESHPINPQSPYAASKSGADQLAISYYRSFGLPVTVVRPFNTYGPRQSARAIIPTVMSQILDGKRIISLGNLSPTRDLSFVADTVSGFLAAAESSDTVGEVLNLGTGMEISIGDLVKKIADLLGVSVEVVTEERRLRPPKSEVERLLSNPNKMRSLTGWVASTKLEDGLRITADWILENRNCYKANLYNI